MIDFSGRVCWGDVGDLEQCGRRLIAKQLKGGEHGLDEGMWLKVLACVIFFARRTFNILCFPVMEENSIEPLRNNVAV